MKIAFVSDAVYSYNKGGKEKRLYELTTRLAARGHEVTVYCMHWWDGPESFRLEDGVRLQAICALYPLYKGDKRSIKQGVMFGLACWRIFKYDFDVIDVDHMPFFPVFSTWLVCLLRGQPLLGTWHEALTRRDWTGYMGRAGLIAVVIERITVQLPYAITAASAHTQALIGTELKRRRRVHLVPSGIDVVALRRVQPAAKPYDVLFVGRLVKDKNAALLIEAVARIAKAARKSHSDTDNPVLSCLIVGSGIEQANITALIAKHGLQQTVAMAGSLPHAGDIYAAMKAAKVFVLPSRREGFGIVVLESLACGTPVVTIDSPANASKALLVEDMNGSVVQPTSQALADAITHWLNANPDRQVIADAATAYDWEVLVDRQETIYLDVLRHSYEQL